MSPPCPRCRAALVPRDEGRLRLDVCPTRHGAFLRAEEMRRAVPVAAHAALEEALAQGRPGGPACPGCGRGMRVLRVTRHGDAIEVDACPACQGHWFDEGELERVRRAPPKSDAAPAAVPEGAKGLASGNGVGMDVAADGLRVILEIVASALTES